MNIEELAQNILFKTITEKDMPTVLRCANAYEKKYQKDACIYHMEDKNVHLGIIIKGELMIIQRDFWGKENVYSTLKQGDTFAETYALYPQIPLLVDVIVQHDAHVLFLDIQTLLSCTDTNVQKVLQNLLLILAEKNLLLSRKIMHITPRTIRERLLSYLQDLCMKQHSNKITIAFTQQQLANYLCVDRSALSNELSKLRKEGILNIQNRTITVKKYK